jgi:Transposase
MQYAAPMLATQPANGLTCGIDWARDDHAIAIVDGLGHQVYRGTVEHSAAGLRELVAVLARTGATEVAIERPDGPVVDALLSAGITVVVISPNQLKNLRSRYGSAGNKDDRFDAFVLADTLRTDRVRLRPLVPDSPATTALRATCRARRDLVAHRVAVANQLREHLKRVFPGPLGLFEHLDSVISLTFLTRFDCQDRADWLTPTRLGTWLKSVRYTDRTAPATLHAPLTAAPRGATGAQGAAHVHITHALVATLGTSNLPNALGVPGRSGHPSHFPQERLRVGDAPGQRLGIAGAEHKRGLSDQLDVLGVGLGQIQRACAGRGDGVRGRRGVDGDPVVVQLGRKAFRESVECRLNRPVDPEPCAGVELRERGSVG